MYGFYNGYSKTGAPCQSHLLLHAGYRYKFKKFYEYGDEVFVEIEGMDNHQNKEANPGFNLSWFATMPPHFAFSKEKPVASCQLEVEVVHSNGIQEKQQFKVLDVCQIAVSTYSVFADDYHTYIVQLY